MPKFIFDLDGTLSPNETLPLIAKHFGIVSDIEEITQKTVRGDLSFTQSLNFRVKVLANLPVDQVADLLFTIPLYEKLHNFILQNKDRCIIATSNLDCWISKLKDRLGCVCYSSKTIVENNKIVKLVSMLKKEDIVKKYQEQETKVIFIGDGYNDLVAMRQADLAIACAIAYEPADEAIKAAKWTARTEEEMCSLLENLL